MSSPKPNRGPHIKGLTPFSPKIYASCAAAMNKHFLTCVLIVLIVLVLLCAVLASSAHGRHLPYLTSEARDEFFRFVAAHPKSRAYEERRSGVPDVTRYPEKFFAFELAEREHSDVARATKANGGLITLEPMRRWIQENLQETAQY